MALLGYRLCFLFKLKSSSSLPPPLVMQITPIAAPNPVFRHVLIEVPYYVSNYAKKDTYQKSKQELTCYGTQARFFVKPLIHR